MKHTTCGELLGPGDLLLRHARGKPGALAVACMTLDGSIDRLSWAELEQWSAQVAHLLIERGVTQGSRVTIELPNSVAHVVASQAIWRIGGCPVPLSNSLPAPELNALLALSNPRVRISVSPRKDGISLADMLAVRHGGPRREVPTCIPEPTKAIASGGSTGKPKLILTPGAFAAPNGDHPLARLLMMSSDDTMFSPGPLYHNQAFYISAVALYAGAASVFVERFRTSLVLSLIETLQVTFLSSVPTMLSRLLADPEFSPARLASIRLLFHGAAPCPDWLKRRWIEMLGPDVIWELWGSTEVTGFAMISGREWLRKPGSVGKPVLTALRILTEKGTPAAVHEVGEIYSRLSITTDRTYEYLGQDSLPQTEDGLISVGDMGYLDEEGYLFLADRRTDLIISGGANIYPAEVEQALSAHPQVADVAVIGLADGDLGKRVHAVIEPRDAEHLPAEPDLRSFCAARIASYKIPRSFEFVQRLPRDDAGKLRRSALRR